MTRFARAKGSKASNKRLPNEATPWHIMKQQLEESKSKEPSKKRKSAKELLKDQKETFDSNINENINQNWAEFDDDRSKSNTKKHKNTNSNKNSTNFTENSTNDSICKNCERKITIKGNIDQIAQAVIEIKDQVREEHKHQTELEYKDTESKTKMSDPKGFSFVVGEHEFSNMPLNDGLIEVRLGDIYDLSKFWIRMVGPADDAYNKLLQEIQEYYDKIENRELHLLQNIEDRQMVIAASSKTGKWYRAKVFTMVSDYTYKVYFVDEGGWEEVVSVCLDICTEILEIRTDMLSLQAQGIECSLANIKLRGKRKDWVPSLFKVVDKCFDQFFAKIKGYTKRPNPFVFNQEIVIPCIDLYAKCNERNTTINVAEYLISLYPKDLQFDENIYAMANPTSSCEELQSSSKV